MTTFLIIAYALLAVISVRSFIIADKREKWRKSEYEKAKKKFNLPD